MNCRPTLGQITILGVGNILLKDEGVGVRVVERLNAQYELPDNVQALDGGVLGARLMGIISATDRLIVIDTICNHQAPGSLYRLTGDEIPLRIRSKNSLHQVDLLETLALCATIDRQPETVIIGVEPADIATLDIGLTPIVNARIDDLIGMALKELDRLGVTYAKTS